MNIFYDNTTHVDRSPGDLLRAGVPQEIIDEEAARIAAIAERDALRGKIARDAGDLPSLLGTTSDVGSFALLLGACFMAALDEDTDYRTFRKRAYDYMKNISGDLDPTVVAQEFLASLASGEMRVPALEKGVANVLAEVKDRSTAIAEAINPEGK